MAPPNARLADRAWLERRYARDGATVAAIAVEAAADPSNVWRALARHGIATRGPAGRRTLAGVSDRKVKAALRRHPTCTDAARALSVDPGTLSERLAAMGLRPRPDPQGDAGEIAAAYQAGATLAELAESYGVSVRTVTRRLAAGGVAPRPRGRPAGS